MYRVSLYLFAIAPIILHTAVLHSCLSSGQYPPVGAGKPVLRTGGEYSDKYKCKADRNTNVFTDQGERSDVSKLRKGDEMRIIAELRYIWVNNGKFGATWVAKQIQFRSNNMDEMEFQDDKFNSDDSDDEEVEPLKMSDITRHGYA